MKTASVAGSAVVTVHAPRSVLPGDGVDVVVESSAPSPGIVTGEVTLSNRIAYRFRQFGALGGATTARADRTQVADRQSLPPAASGDTPSVIGAVVLRVPVDALPSVSGELVQITWRVTVRIEVSGAPDAVVSRTVQVLSADSHRPALGAGPLRVVNRGIADLSFEGLSGDLVVPGTALTGALTVAALRPVNGRSLRLELIVLEQVHRGPWVGDDDPGVVPEGQEKEAETRVATATLATGLRIAAQRRTFPFTLAVPHVLPGPSLDTPEFCLRWVLRGVLDRVHRRDPTVEMELRGLTAPASPPERR